MVPLALDARYAALLPVHRSCGHRPRLLRDLDGHLIRHDGRYWWIYRAQRKDAPTGIRNPVNGQPVPSPTLYRPALASASSLAQKPWTKEGVAWNTTRANTGLFDVGSFIRAASIHNAVGALGSGVTFPTHPYWNRTNAGDMAFLPTAVPFDIVTPDSNNGLNTGANIVRDPATGVQYAVQVAFDIPNGRFSVWLFRAIPD